MSEPERSEPVQAELVDPAPLPRVLSRSEAAAIAAVIRSGSPFAPGTALPLELVGDQIPFETGVWQETMLGGLAASFIMILFGLGSLFTFPAGSVMIAAAGCLLAVMALGTRRPLAALTAAFGNLAVLAIGFARLVI